MNTYYKGDDVLVSRKGARWHSQVIEVLENNKYRVEIDVTNEVLELDGKYLSYAT